MKRVGDEFATDIKSGVAPGAAVATTASQAPVDLTTAVSDYVLAAGEAVFLSYSNATTVPLMVATSEGVYQVEIIATSRSYKTGDPQTFLRPNNALTTAGDSVSIQKVWGPADTETSTFNKAPNSYYTALPLGYGGPIHGLFNISTFLNCKNITGTLFAYGVAPQAWDRQRNQIDAIWTDIVTPWVSLGTIIFPVAHSGKIIIRRIL